MNILHISAECYPAAKAGGLADVVGALPKYQNLIGHKASVLMPHYHNKFFSANEFEDVYEGEAFLGYVRFYFKVVKLKKNKLGFDLFMIDIPGLFDREGIYSYNDDTERFVTFQIAAINWIGSWKKVPDVIHCHDQHTGFIPFMMYRVEYYNRLKDIPTVFTIHNGQYQGQFGMDKLGYIPPFHSFYNGLIEWGGAINPLASAIKCAWKVTTVSPSYMEEISHSMKGLEGLLRMEKGKSTGILNGIDTDVWNPATDKMLVSNYTAENAAEGKAANKAWLCEEFNLDPEKPLFAFIGRLVEEKGADVMPDAFYQALYHSPGEQNILVLGSGNGDTEHALWKLEELFKGNYCSYLGYNEKLSHVIYAGADFLLMPSRVEPCGLNQLYALRYGTVPIVRRTGGLKDTVIDIGDDGFGICHDECSSWDIQFSINRAKELYNDRVRFNKIQQRIMQLDHSWEKAAMDYVNLYKTLK